MDEELFKKGLEKTFLWYLNNQKYYTTIKRINILKRLGLNKWLKRELY